MLLVRNCAAGGGDTGDNYNVVYDAYNGTDTGKCMEDYSDENGVDESPIKRPRTVSLPDPMIISY